jgi:hypothetical protein
MFSIIKNFFYPSPNNAILLKEIAKNAEGIQHLETTIDTFLIAAEDQQRSFKEIRNQLNSILSAVSTEKRSIQQVENLQNHTEEIVAQSNKKAKVAKARSTKTAVPASALITAAESRTEPAAASTNTEVVQASIAATVPSAAAIQIIPLQQFITIVVTKHKCTTLDAFCKAFVNSTTDSEYNTYIFTALQYYPSSKMNESDSEEVQLLNLMEILETIYGDINSTIKTTASKPAIAFLDKLKTRYTAYHPTSSKPNTATDKISPTAEQIQKIELSRSRASIKRSTKFITTLAEALMKILLLKKSVL